MSFSGPRFFFADDEEVVADFITLYIMDLLFNKLVVAELEIYCCYLLLLSIVVCCFAFFYGRARWSFNHTTQQVGKEPSKERSDRLCRKEYDMIPHQCWLLYVTRSQITAFPICLGMFLLSLSVAIEILEISIYDCNTSHSHRDK